MTVEDNDGWYVYMILCSDESLYTGISTDIEKRFQAHANQKGARYFRGRDPLELVYAEGGHDRASASRREYQIKQLTRLDKMKLVRADSNLLSS